MISLDEDSERVHSHQLSPISSSYLEVQQTSFEMLYICNSMIPLIWKCHIYYEGTVSHPFFFFFFFFMWRLFIRPKTRPDMTHGFLKAVSFSMNDFIPIGSHFS